MVFKGIIEYHKFNSIGFIKHKFLSAIKFPDLERRGQGRRSFFILLSYDVCASWGYVELNFLNSILRLLCMFKYFHQIWYSKLWLTLQTCFTFRNFIEIWCRAIFIGSSAYITWLYSFMEWCLGWKRWTKMVGSNSCGTVLFFIVFFIDF